MVSSSLLSCSVESASSTSGRVVLLLTMFGSVLSVISVRDRGVVVAGVVGGLESMVEEVEEGVEGVVEVVVVVKRPTVKVRLSLAPEPLLPPNTYSSIWQVHWPASLASKPDISMAHSWLLYVPLMETLCFSSLWQSCMMTSFWI